MNKKTLQITMGAAIIAVFIIMLLLNRQSGGFFEEIFMYLYPIPMVAYAAEYGWKKSLPVLVGMVLFAFLFGTFTTVFYAVSEAGIGLIFGGCLHRKADMTKTLFLVMILSVIANLLDTIILAGMFGIDLNQQIQEMQEMLTGVITQTGIVLPETFLSENYLKQMFVIVMVVLGGLQGFIIYELSLMVLRRLRFPVQKPKSIFLYYPPRWTGYFAIICFFGQGMVTGKPLENDMIQNIIQVLGISASMYLVCFGFIAVVLYLRMRIPRIRFFVVVICILGYLMVPMLFVAAGFFYVSTRFHQNLLEGQPS